MEKRLSIRQHVFLNAALEFGDTIYTGLAGNISKKGVYICIKSANAKTNFAIGTKFDLSLELPSEEILKLNCRLVWAYEIPRDISTGRSSYNLGVEIIEPDLTYEKFYNYLTQGILKSSEGADEGDREKGCGSSS